MSRPRNFKREKSLEGRKEALQIWHNLWCDMQLKYNLRVIQVKTSRIHLLKTFNYLLLPSPLGNNCTIWWNLIEFNWSSFHERVTVQCGIQYTEMVRYNWKREAEGGSTEGGRLAEEKYRFELQILIWVLELSAKLWAKVTISREKLTPVIHSSSCYFAIHERMKPFIMQRQRCL